MKHDVRGPRSAFRISRSRKSLGQHFLTNPAVLQQIVQAAELTKADTVLEIGPGRGNLTRRLAHASGRVFAVELDRGLIPRLKAGTADIQNLHLIHGDALTIPFHRLTSGSVVVANLPYSVATPILMRLIEERARFSRMVLTFQREVAERITAEPGTRDYGSLTLAVQYAMETEFLFSIPPGAFSPPPKVDSAVVRLVPLPAPRVSPVNERFLFSVIRQAFAMRRKTLRNALRGMSDPETLNQAGETCGIDLGRRGETLSLREFTTLADFLFERTERKG